MTYRYIFRNIALESWQRPNFKTKLLTALAVYRDFHKPNIFRHDTNCNIFIFLKLSYPLF